MDDEKYYRESESLRDDDGNDVEINRVVYERSDGSVDYVEQTKVDGREIGHHTEHPDGTIHDYGIYSETEDDDEYRLILLVSAIYDFGWVVYDKTIKS